MKRFVIFLFGLCLLSGIAAQQTVNDTIGPKATDSTTQAYQNASLSSREAILLEKLSADQLMELEQQRMAFEKKIKQGDLPLPPPAIVMISLAPFIMVVLIVFFSVRAKNRREQLQYDLYVKSLESGRPLPDKIFEGNPKKTTSRLQSALVWFGVGISLVLLAFILDKDKLFFGIIPAFVGLGILIAYMIEKPKKDNTTSEIADE